MNDEDRGWRVGRKLGRTLYFDGKLMGMMDSAEVAASVCDVLNGAEYPPEGSTYLYFGSSVADITELRRRLSGAEFRELTQTKRLKELLGFVSHRSCARNGLGGAGADCTCGLDEVLARIR